MGKFRSYLIILGLTLPLAACNWQLSWQTWGQMAECEAHGEWDYGPHSTWGSRIYHGGLQIHPSNWIKYGGREFATYAYQATAIEQMIVAERILEAEGLEAWPTCSRELGLR